MAHQPHAPILSDPASDDGGAREVVGDGEGEGEGEGDECEDAEVAPAPTGVVEVVSTRREPRDGSGGACQHQHRCVS